MTDLLRPLVHTAFLSFSKKKEPLIKVKKKIIELTFWLYRALAASTNRQSMVLRGQQILA